MSKPADTLSTGIDQPAVHQAGAGLLSLALMDARNHSLKQFSWLMEVCANQSYPEELAQREGINPPVWTFGYLGWFQERWTVRNLQWRQGMLADGTRTPLASVEPLADALWGTASLFDPTRWTRSLPSASAVRAYLLETLELALGLLEKADDDNNALYFFRHCLYHEDQAAEALWQEAQRLGLPP